MRIGIVGSGGIIPQCLDALKNLDNSYCVAICVREPKREYAEELAKKYNFSKIYTDYKEMLLDSEIDFVYIGIVNSLHYEYAKIALQNGKNVITEKPFTSTEDEASEIINLAKDKNLYLFEAITLIHSPNYKTMKSYINKIGDIKLIQCNFSQFSSRYNKYLNGEIMPAFDPNLSGGALYDINIYNIHFVVGLFGEPKEVQYIANIGYNGIDTSGIVTMKYDNFVASLIGAKDSSSPNYALVQGTKGYIKVTSSVNICSSIEIAIDDMKEELNYEKFQNHMVNEFKEFEEIYENKDIEECYRNLDHSLHVMKTVYRARMSCGIYFNADNVSSVN